MVEVVLWEWLDLALRWLHVVAGIAWIGNSFYFVHLDLSLRRRDGLPEGAAGEAWQVHGGGFYNMVKYLVAPARMPDRLTWFKWEAYTTWLSGMALLVLVYYLQADLYMIAPGLLALAPWQAVAVSLAGLALGWVVYDLLCRSPLGRNDTALALVGLVFLTLLAWGCWQVFSGRGAMMQMGALIGTIMVANVFLVIIPGQRKVVKALIAGEDPDPELGRRGKQRSLHNNYLTLPVVFAMIGNHYPLAFAGRWSWLILADPGDRPGPGGGDPALLQPAPQGRGESVVDLGRGPGRHGRDRLAERRAGHGGRGRGQERGVGRPGRGRGDRAVPLQHVPRRRAGVGGHRPATQGRGPGDAGGDPPPGPGDRPPCRPDPRHAAGQRHRDLRRGAPDPGGLDRRRRARLVAACPPRPNGPFAAAC